MSPVGLESLEHTVQLTHIWINELDERLGWNNRLLKAVLHALRDRLQLSEAADLAAQLPTLLHGAYYEQWRPAATPVKRRTKADFLAQVEESFEIDSLAQPSQASRRCSNCCRRRSPAARSRMCAGPFQKSLEICGRNHTFVRHNDALAPRPRRLIALRCPGGYISVVPGVRRPLNDRCARRRLSREGVDRRRCPPPRGE
jgi:uncharacterized protein (DUF2267 family)